MRIGLFEVYLTNWCYEPKKSVRLNGEDVFDVWQFGFVEIKKFKSYESLKKWLDK